MINVVYTEQEKKDMATIYGFLADVWAARQTKTAGGAGFVQPGRDIAGKRGSRRAA